MKVNFFYFYREITCVHLGNLWTHLWVHACMLNCVWLCNSMNYSPPDSVVHELFQAKILRWVATSYTRGSCWPKDPSCVSCTSYTGRQVFYHCTTWEALTIAIQCCVSFCHRRWISCMCTYIPSLLGLPPYNILNFNLCCHKLIFI